MSKDGKRLDRSEAPLPAGFFAPPPGVARLDYLRQQLWYARLLRRHGGLYSVGFCDRMIATLKQEIEKETSLF